MIPNVERVNAPNTTANRMADSGTGEILVSVADTGTGLEPGNADRIFDPLFTTKTHGMGMGWQSAVRSSKPMAGGSGPRQDIPEGAFFPFPFPYLAKIYEGAYAQGKPADSLCRR